MRLAGRLTLLLPFLLATRPATPAPAPAAAQLATAPAAPGVSAGPGVAGNAGAPRAALSSTTPAALDAPDAARGRRIFRRGLGSGSVPITAALAGTGGAGAPSPSPASGVDSLPSPTGAGAAGAGGVSAEAGADAIPASAMPCAGCHGSDRRGRPEAGVLPPDITWASLSSPASFGAPVPRQRPAYTPRQLKRAITLGYDSAGHPLQATMPRYQMSQSDMDDLLAYLTSATDAEPGISATEIAVGVLLPPPQQLPAAHRAIREAIAGYLESRAADRVTKGGGELGGPGRERGDSGRESVVYGRRLVVRFVDAPADPAARADALRALAQDGVFALLVPWIAGTELASLDAIAGEEIPALGVLGESPPPAAASRFAFYFATGLAENAPILARMALSRLGAAPRRRSAIFHDGSPEQRAAAVAIATECAKSGWEPPAVVDLSTLNTAGPADLASLVARHRDSGTSLVFYLGPAASLDPLFAAARAADWTPHLLTVGPLASPATTAHLALAATHLFLEAVKRAGRDLTRDKLLTALESLYRYPTNDIPPVTFSPARHQAIQGIPVLWLDLAHPAVDAPTDWIDLD